MKLTKLKDGNCLVMKLSRRDWKYLNGFKKYESARTIKNTDKYLNDMLAVHIKTVFVMQTALMLEQENLVSKAKISAAFDALDKSFRSYERVVDKYFAKFGDLLDSKSKKKKKQKSR